MLGFGHALAASASLDVIGGGSVASGVPRWAGAAWRAEGRASQLGTRTLFMRRPHLRQRAAGPAIPRRTGIDPGPVPQRAGPGRTRARRWPQVRCGADARAGRLEPQRPPVLAARADLGEFHLAPPLLAQPRGARHDLPAGPREPADPPPLGYRPPAGRAAAAGAERLKGK